MTVDHVTVEPRPLLPLHRKALKALLSVYLPRDEHFKEAWQVYERALGRFNDNHRAIVVLRSLSASGLPQATLALAEAEYDSNGKALGGAVQAVLDCPCVRPENMQRKIMLAITENADARDLASLYDDLGAMQFWLLRR
jgi:hypothetical protein